MNDEIERARPNISPKRPQAAVIMAAGKGTRMRSKRSKVLHEVAGVPMISRVVQSAIDAGITKVVIVVGHQSEEVIECVNRRFSEINLSWALQAEQRGTAHAVMCAEEALSEGEGFHGDVWILSGDVPTLSADLLRELHQDHLNASLMVTGLKLEEPKSYGRLLRDADGSLYEIREARDCSSEQLLINEVNAGLYRVDAQLLFEGLKTIKTDNAQGEYYLTDLVAFAAQRGSTIDCPILSGERASELEGVNDRIDLAAAEERAQRRIANSLMRNGVTLLKPETLQASEGIMIGEDSLIERDVTIIGSCIIGDNVIIERGVWIKDSIIDSGAVIRAYSHLEGAQVGPNTSVGPFARLREGTVLERGVKVGNFVEIKKAIFEEGAKASHLSYLGDARIGRNANIGAGTITCNYDGYEKHFTEIGAGAFIGSDSQLVAPVKIGEGAFVAAGSTVTQDVPADGLILTRAPTVHREGWASRFHLEKAQVKGQS